MTEFVAGRGVTGNGLVVEFLPERDQVLADVHFGHGVELQLVRMNDSDQWEVWAVRIDGVVYRAPRGVHEGEWLQSGQFAFELARAEAHWRRQSPEENQQRTLENQIP